MDASLGFGSAIGAGIVAIAVAVGLSLEGAAALRLWRRQLPERSAPAVRRALLSALRAASVHHLSLKLALLRSRNLPALWRHGGSWLAIFVFAILFESLKAALRTEGRWPAAQVAPGLLDWLRTAMSFLSIAVGYFLGRATFGRVKAIFDLASRGALDPFYRAKAAEIDAAIEARSIASATGAAIPKAKAAKRL